MQITFVQNMFWMVLIYSAAAAALRRRGVKQI